MTRTHARPSAAATRGPSAYSLHRDGTVTLWSARRQQWERGRPSPDSDHWHEMDEADRVRILRHILRHDRGGDS